MVGFKGSDWEESCEAWWEEKRKGFEFLWR